MYLEEHVNPILTSGVYLLCYAITMNPKRDIILIEADKPREKTDSGLYIVEDWKTLPQTGVVIAIGPDVTDRDLVGRHVVFERYASVIVKDNLRFCNESHILAEIPA